MTATNRLTRVTPTRTHSAGRCLSSAAAATATAPSSRSAFLEPVVSSSVSNVHALIRQVYGPDLLSRIQQPARAHQLLHVTSMWLQPGDEFQPSLWSSLGSDTAEAATATATATGTPGGAGVMYTLRVGAGCLTHPLDRFALNLSRMLSTRIVFTGSILRLEPGLTCTFDQSNFRIGMELIRSAKQQTTMPHITILTRTPEQIDWNHPIFDAMPAQEVEVWYGESAWIDQLAGANKHTHHAGMDGIFLPLSFLRASSPLLSSRLSSVVSSKLIHFRLLPAGRLADTIHAIRAQQSTDTLACDATCTNGFMQHISIEAGPTVTNRLYFPQADTNPHQPTPTSTDSTQSSSHSSFDLSHHPPISTLLLTLYRGTILPGDYSKYLVYPATTTATQHPHSPLPPHPSMTIAYLRRHYRYMGGYTCPTDENWTFAWFERKEHHDHHGDSG